MNDYISHPKITINSFLASLVEDSLSTRNATAAYTTLAATQAKQTVYVLSINKFVAFLFCLTLSRKQEGGISRTFASSWVNSIKRDEKNLYFNNIPLLLYILLSAGNVRYFCMLLFRLVFRVFMSFMEACCDYAFLLHAIHKFQFNANCARFVCVAES